MQEGSSIPGWGRSPGEGMATQSSILAWRIPWTGQPGALQSMGSQKSQTPLCDQTITNASTNTWRSYSTLLAKVKGIKELIQLPCMISKKTGPSERWTCQHNITKTRAYSSTSAKLYSVLFPPSLLEVSWPSMRLQSFPWNLKASSETVIQSPASSLTSSYIQ